MIREAMSWFSALPIVSLKGVITREIYRENFRDCVHPMMQTLFPAGNGFFQDDQEPTHAARLIQPRFDEPEYEVKHVLVRIVT